MTAMDRSLVPVGIVFLIASGVWLTAVTPRSAPPQDAWTLVVWGVAVVASDVWSYRFSTRVHWSYGSAVIAAPLVLSTPGSAPLIAAALGALGALTDTEFDQPNLGRLLANVGQLMLAGVATGVAFDQLRPDAVEPSTALVGAVASSFALNVILNSVFVAVGASYAYGKVAVRGLVTATFFLGWRKIVAAVAAAAIASTVTVIGSAWIAFALVQIAALGAVPIVRARLEARRRDIMQAVISALNARGVVGSAHDQLEATALTLGHRLGLNSDQIEQLRYVSLLFSMTDHFASALPRSFEDRLRGLDDDAFSSALLLGLPLQDVADGVVLRVAEAAAEYESLIHPVDGGEPMSPNEAAADLLRSGADPQIVASLLDEKPLPASYLRAWEIDPASPWRRPMKWLAEHASGLAVRGASR